MAVYVIHPENRIIDHVKIGYTVDLERRLVSIGAAYPCSMVKVLVFETAGREFEGFLHTLFDEFRGKGEWFTYNGRLRTLLKITQADSLEEIWLDWFNLGERGRLYVVNDIFRMDELGFLLFWLVGTKAQRAAIYQLIKALIASNKRKSVGEE